MHVCPLRAPTLGCQQREGGGSTHLHLSREGPSHLRVAAEVRMVITTIASAANVKWREHTHQILAFSTAHSSPPEWQHGAGSQIQRSAGELPNNNCPRGDLPGWGGFERVGRCGVRSRPKAEQDPVVDLSLLPAAEKVRRVGLFSSGKARGIKNWNLQTF